MSGQKLTVYLDAGLAERLRATAAGAGVTQGQLVAQALRATLGRSRQKGPVAAGRVAERLRERGATLEQLARELNRRGFRTALGRPWTVMGVSRLLRATPCPDGSARR